MTYDIKCIVSGKCVEVCPVEAIVIDQRGRRINRAKCNLCLACAEVCPTGAISVSGRYVTVEEVVKEVERDGLFYQNSGGGVTLSGGEPLCQWEFALQLLKECKGKGIHTALDTCGYAPWKVMEKVLDYTDLVLFDIKHMEAEQHRKGTGKSNKLILNNARRTAAKVRTWLRVPLIPGYNDSEENLKKIARLGLEIGVEKVSLLPYHLWGRPKYTKLGRRYPMEHTLRPSEELVKRAQGIIEGFGLKATIGR